jgi:hypothetical protein
MSCSCSRPRVVGPPPLIWTPHSAGAGPLPLIWTPPAREASRLWNRDPSLLSSMRPSSQRELSSTSIEPSEKSAWAQTPGAPHAPYAHRVPQSESQIVSLAAGATRPVSGA